MMIVFRITKEYVLELLDRLLALFWWFLSVSSSVLENIIAVVPNQSTIFFILP